MSSTIDTSTRLAVNKAIQMLEVFRTLDADMPIGEALSFLLIAQGEDADGRGLTVSDLRDRGGFALASASRYMRRLSTQDRKGDPGHGIVTDIRDPLDDRKKILRISSKGSLYIQLIKTAVG